MEIFIPKDKIQQIYPEKYELEKKLENDWQNFLKRDTYLIFDEKKKFFKEINQLVKFTRRTLFKLKVRGSIRHFRKKLHKLIEEINNYNHNLVERQLRNNFIFVFFHNS